MERREFQSLSGGGSMSKPVRARGPSSNVPSKLVKTSSKLVKTRQMLVKCSSNARLGPLSNLSNLSNPCQTCQTRQTRPSLPAPARRGPASAAAACCARVPAPPPPRAPRRRRPRMPVDASSAVGQRFRPRAACGAMESARAAAPPVKCPSKRARAAGPAVKPSKPGGPPGPPSNHVKPVKTRTALGPILPPPDRDGVHCRAATRQH